MPNLDVQQPADLARILASLGHVAPSTIAPVVTAGIMEAFLDKPSQDPGAPPAVPLWDWLHAAIRAGQGWSAQDCAQVDQWLGGQPGHWWELPVGTGTLLDTWLSLSLWHADPESPAFLGTLEAIPVEHFTGPAGSRRLLAIMATERARAVRKPEAASAAASESLLARGADPFEDMDNARLAFTLRQFAFLRQRHRTRLREWLATPGNAAALLPAVSDDTLRRSLQRLAPPPAASPAATEFVAELDTACHRGLPVARAFLRNHPEGARHRVTQDRTPFMAVLAKRGSPVRLLSVLGGCARVLALRHWCEGHDAQGHTLLPYALRIGFVDENAGSAGLRGIAAAVQAAHGRPAADGDGHGLLYQVLHDTSPSGPNPCDVEGWEHITTSLADAFKATPSEWLRADATDTDLPVALLDRVLAKPSAPSRGLARFLAAVSRDVSQCAPELAPAWQALFLNATLADAIHAHERYMTQWAEDSLVEARRWAMPHARIDARIDALLASTHISLESDRRAIEETLEWSRTVNQLAASSDRLLLPTISLPATSTRRTRPRG